MAYTTSDLVTELAGLEYPVYIGGPVEQNQLYYLHNHAEVEDALQIVPGIYWGRFLETDSFVAGGENTTGRSSLFCRI